MMSKICLISGDGIGGQLLSFQCGKILKDKGHDVTILVSARDEVFKPLNYLLGKKFKIIQIAENYQNDLLNFNDLHYTVLQLVNQIFDEIYIVYPDLLFRHSRSFDYKKFNLSLQVIKDTRVLIEDWAPEKLIYLGLATSTPGYLYPEISQLIVNLAQKLPDYKIYLPNIKKWDKPVNLGDFSLIDHKNVHIHDSPDFLDSLEYLKKAAYGIFTCNGPSHIAHQLGIPKLILDPQFNKIPWISRWKDDYQDCIPINTAPDLVSSIVKHNIQTECTQLIDRKFLYQILSQNPSPDWKNIFYLKY